MGVLVSVAVVVVSCVLAGEPALAGVPPSAPGVWIRVDAKGVVTADGVRAVKPAADDFVIPALVVAVGKARAEAPGETVYVDADPAAPVTAVGAAVGSAQGGPVVLVTEGEDIPLARASTPDPGGPAPRPPLSVWLHDDAVTLLRRVGRSIVLPDPDADTLRAAFAADARLHRGARLAVVAADADVPYSEALATLRLLQEAGYRDLLFLPSPAAPPKAPPERPARPSGRPEVPTHARFLPEGGVDFMPGDGEPETFAHEDLRAFEAWCDATTCDVVARTEDRRVLIGAVPREDLRLGWLLARPVHVWEERLDAVAPLRGGVASPFVFVPRDEAR